MRSGIIKTTFILGQVLLAITLLVGTVGCSATVGNVAKESKRILPLTVRWGSGDLPAGDRVLRDREAFEEAWKSAEVKAAPPEIDFDKDMVLLSARGCLPNACYRTRFVSFTVEGTGGQAWLEDEDPSPNCFCALTLTCPFHMVKVPRLDGPVEFEHRLVLKKCVQRRRP